MALQVQLVAADRSVWSGEATTVIARTVDGDLGVLPGHEPLFAELASGVVLVRTTDGEQVAAAVHGGFISVENDTVSLLAEVAELSHEIDVARARAGAGQGRATARPRGRRVAERGPAAR